MLAIMKRIEPEENMDRWYLVAVQATLFDPVAVITAWGSRETTYQQMRIFPTGSEEEALDLAARIVGQKLRLGYILIHESGCAAERLSSTTT
jgi:predicted DNA-binding WGR domain protein